MGTNKKSPVRNLSLENNVQNKYAVESPKDTSDVKSVMVNSPKKCNSVRTIEFNKTDSNEYALAEKTTTDEVMNSSQIKSTTKSIPSNLLLVGDNSEISTISLSDSATVTIPVHPTQMERKVYPKFKTMPSPTRTPQTLITSPQLNEIFEENVVDFNKSENRSNRITGINYEQRRSKFHKARTASCSSSDASDDDSESRKKRAHKISTEKNNQRRDSHDDSSDSQDRGGGGGGGGGAGANPNSALGNSGDGMHNQNHSTGGEQNESSSGSDGKGGSSSRRQCNGENFRRSRRRTAETRLRESQSLNRITEVQESESHATIEIFHERIKKKESEDCTGRDASSSNNKNSINTNNNNKNINSKSIHINSNNNNNNTIVFNAEKNKSVKSLGARFLQSWSNTISSTKLTVNRRKCSMDERSSRGNNGSEDQVPKQYGEEKENKMLLEKSEKKVKLLGKYFQVGVKATFTDLSAARVPLRCRTDAEFSSRCQRNYVYLYQI